MGKERRIMVLKVTKKSLHSLLWDLTFHGKIPFIKRTYDLPNCKNTSFAKQPGCPIYFMTWFGIRRPYNIVFWKVENEARFKIERRDSIDEDAATDSIIITLNVDELAKHGLLEEESEATT